MGEVSPLALHEQQNDLYSVTCLEMDSLHAPASCKNAPVYDCKVVRDGSCIMLKLFNALYAAGLRTYTANAT